MNSVLMSFYGVTLEYKYRLMSHLIISIVTLSWVMAVVYKPKRTDAGYKRFLYFHFFTFAVVGEVSFAIGDFRSGKYLAGWVPILRIPVWYLNFWLGLKLRTSAAKLPPQELSDFLCQTVLVKGFSAMGTMLFFSFEAVSCFISQESFDNGQCVNTSLAAMCLSGYLVLLTALSIVSKTVPKIVQRETAWGLSSIASLKDLKWWQQIQGGLMVVTAISSLYLLGWLGVEGNGNSAVWIVGAVGGISILVAAMVNMTMLIRTAKEHQQQQDTTVELPTKRRSIRAISSGQVEERMFAIALV